MYEFGDEVPKVDRDPALLKKEEVNHEKVVRDAEQAVEASMQTLREVIGNGDWKAIAAKNFRPASAGRSPDATPPGSQVNHPEHYNQGSLEVIEAIEGLRLGFHEGNALKYLARWRMKGGVTDLRKAIWYVLRLIEQEDFPALQTLAEELLGSAFPEVEPAEIRQQLALWQATAERHENG